MTAPRGDRPANPTPPAGPTTLRTCGIPGCTQGGGTYRCRAGDCDGRAYTIRMGCAYAAFQAHYTNHVR